MTGQHGFWRPLREGTALAPWALAAPVETPFPGRARPMPDRVDYRFRNGFTQTGDLPCRQALREMLADREVARPEGPFEAVALAAPGGDLDFSGFRFTPTLVVRAMRCRIRTEGGRARIALETCGGLRLWIGDAEAAVFEPFERNGRGRAEMRIDLPEGAHDLTLRLEDLHERDTECLARIEWLGGPPAEIALPDGLALDADEARALSDGLAIAPFHEGGAEIVLRCDPPPRRAVPLSWPEPAQFPRGGLCTDPAPRRVRHGTLTPERPELRIMGGGEAPPGCLSVEVTAHLGPAALTRRLGTTVLPEGEALGGRYRARAERAARIMLDAPAFDPSTAALLACRGARPDHVARVVSAGLDTVEARHDCSDFTILPLLRIWRDALDALPPALAARLRRAILGWRYWLSEPGDDVMWFWSENHVMCFHAAQAVAGALLPGETFANSGRTGADLAEEATARLHRWFDAVDAHGLCEWNSAAYYPIDLLGLLTLHDMAPALAARAAAVMDRIMAMTALHALAGVPAGSQGRCYEKELLAGPMTELGSVAAIAFGGRYAPGHDRAAALMCLSDYAPPAQAARLAAPQGVIEARYAQGTGRLTLWKSPHAQLSTASGHAAGTEGHQAHVIDLRLSGHPMSRAWINHPGETRAWGERRPSMLAGNHVMPRVAQEGPTALLIHDLARPWCEVPRANLYAAAMERGRAGDWHLLRSGDGLAAIWCSAPLSETAGTHAGALRTAPGPRIGWAVSVALPGETEAAFAARLGTPAFDAETLTLRARAHDGRPLRLAHDGPFEVDGRARPDAPLPTEPHVSYGGGPMTPWRDA